MIEELPIDKNERREYLRKRGLVLSESLLSKTFAMCDSPMFSMGGSILSCNTWAGEPKLDANEIFVIYKREGDTYRGTIVPRSILSLDKIREDQINKIFE
jgi:hypothetical protein